MCRNAPNRVDADDSGSDDSDRPNRRFVDEFVQGIFEVPLNDEMPELIEPESDDSEDSEPDTPLS